MSSIYFFNFDLEENTEYFLYIGELKNYGLNLFLSEALSKIHNRKFKFIAIVPDVYEQYNYENIIVINPLADANTQSCGENFHCRLPAKEFMGAVSKNEDVRSLIKQLLKRQENLYLYLYESLGEMTLDEIPNVNILGPNKDIAKKLNNKSIQMPGLKDIVPVVDFKICNGYHELVQTTDRLWDKWKHGIFATKAYSAAGINSVVAFCASDISEKFNGQDTTYVITRYLPHEHDPTVLGLVASENEVYIAGVADQRIEGGNRFTGSTFPTVLPPETTSKLETYTKQVGQWMGALGYRGIFGCDYIVTHDGDIRFLEINARKQGTTLEFCCTLDNILPNGAPNLPELEYYAVTQGKFPDTIQDVIPELKDRIHWGTFNYKVHESVRTQNYIPQNTGERKAFEKIASGRLKKDFLILEHAGSDFQIAAGSFIARVVALGNDHASVTQGIEQGCKTIELTFNQTT